MKISVRYWRFAPAILTMLSCSIFSPGSTPQPETIPAPADNSSITQDAPLDFFQGIPIMPGAVSGHPIGSWYEYQIEATVLEVQEYYLREMPLAGWMFENQTGDAKTGETSIRLRYTQGDEMTAIFINGAEGGLVQVSIS